MLGLPAPARGFRRAGFGGFVIRSGYRILYYVKHRITGFRVLDSGVHDLGVL